MGIFSNPASGAGRLFRNATKFTDKNTDKAVREVNVNPAISGLQTTAGDLKAQGLSPQSLSGGGLGINIDRGGNLTMNRSGESQGWMDTLGQGLNTDTQSYGDLLNQIQGLGDVPVDQIRADYQKQYGDLQSQLAQRRVLGSSFAQGQLDSVKRQEALDVAQAKYNAFKDQLTMTQSVINDRTTARLNTVQQGLSQINYETGVGATILANTQNNMMKLNDAQVDIAKTIASISAQAAIARGDIRANATGIGANIFQNQAQLSTEGRAAQQESIGSFIGSLMPSASFGQVANASGSGTSLGLTSLAI